MRRAEQGAPAHRRHDEYVNKPSAPRSGEGLVPPLPIGPRERLSQSDDSDEDAAALPPFGARLVGGGVFLRTSRPHHNAPVGDVTRDDSRSCGDHQPRAGGRVTGADRHPAQRITAGIHTDNACRSEALAVGPFKNCGQRDVPGESRRGDGEVRRSDRDPPSVTTASTAGSIQRHRAAGQQPRVERALELRPRSACLAAGRRRAPPTSVDDVDHTSGELQRPPPGNTPPPPRVTSTSSTARPTAPGSVLDISSSPDSARAPSLAVPSTAVQPLMPSPTGTA